MEMERLICTLLILCLVFVNISVCSGEDDVTTTSQDYVYRPTATSRNGLKWIEYTPASPLDLFKLAGHAISRRSEYVCNKKRDGLYGLGLTLNF